MSDILESYLVRLGFQNDEPSFRRFKDILADADMAVDRHASGMVHSLLKAQVGIVSAFTSVSGAVVGLVDKVAMADQEYRLFGQTMLMNQSMARQLKMTTDTLGASMEQIIWDPELSRRSIDLGVAIQKMTGALGPDFEQKMVRLRDIRFEFSKLKLATEFLGMSTVSHLFDKLPLDEIKAKIGGWVTWLEDHVDELGDKLSTGLVPVLKSTWSMFKQLGEVGKEFVIVFQNFMGLLSGDTSIEGSTASFEKFGKAIGYAAMAAAHLFSYIAGIEKSISHFIGALSQLANLNFNGAGKETLEGLKALKGTIYGVGYDVGQVLTNVTPGGTAALGAYNPAYRQMVTGVDLGEIKPPVLSGVLGNVPADLLAKITDAIVAHEGVNSNLIANNNPGNLRFVGQQGATQGVGGFAHFDTYEAGYKAAQSQIALDISRGHDVKGSPTTTLAELISSWAPSSENNTAAYIRDVAERTGIAPGAPLSRSVTTGDIHVNVNVTGTNSSAHEIAHKTAKETTEAFHKLLTMNDLAMMSTASGY